MGFKCCELSGQTQRGIAVGAVSSNNQPADLCYRADIMASAVAFHQLPSTLSLTTAMSTYLRCLYVIDRHIRV